MERYSLKGFDGFFSGIHHKCTIVSSPSNHHKCTIIFVSSIHYKGAINFLEYSPQGKDNFSSNIHPKGKISFAKALTPRVRYSLQG
ncbi:hypothetical protein HHI36_008148 [Cryptolaemus montrouzieri]|uniref:Uncharacterized protein n=1 Tax=Cryptolaemus montrouzieri TaxID=559131 RepID=A0ABD2MRP3_9CUCU